MSKFRLYLVAAICLFVVVGIFKGFQTPEPKLEYKLYPSYPGSYRTLKDLVRQSDLVVVGRISSQESQGFFGDSKIPYTDFNFTITKVVYGEAEDNVIILRQTGGEIPGQAIAETERNPLFKVSEEALLFLRRWEPGKYNLIGGPNGRFPISGENISSLNPYIKASGDATEFINSLVTLFK